MSPSQAREGAAEVFEPFATADTFCEALARVERIGAVDGSFSLSATAVSAVADWPLYPKLIVPAELMADLAQMLAADYAESGAAFERMPANAMAN